MQKSRLSAFFGDLSAQKSGHQLTKILPNQPTANLGNLLPQLEIPWAKPGWFDAAESWIQTELQRQGLKAIAPIEVVKNWALAIILRVPTTEGMIYFKASSPLFAQEAEFTRILAQRYRQNIPEVLATCPDKSWILMREIEGEILENMGDIFHWEAALHQWAKFQISAIEHRSDLIACGWVDLGVEHIAKTLEGLFDPRLRLPWNYGKKLANRELLQLLPLVPKLQKVLEQFRELNIPDTLVHGDLSPRNIYLRDQGFVYFDWSDTCISHPFFDLIRFLYEISKDLPDVTDARSRIRNAYLAPWTIYAPMEQLVSTFEFASATLVSLYEAISDRLLRENWGNQWGNQWGKQWGNHWQGQTESAVSFYLQRLLIQVATYLHFFRHSQ
ncbi:aminoglycoside phosphotransferase family protein [Planktothricoides raciborskii]|uniref:Aminoglycoside phosphotransferase family protein n=1 Tax=Planktothricoides raciborskii GIHE-MW2 TaxID=2792601 RepID=A0AAU8JJV5_9CYAN